MFQEILNAYGLNENSQFHPFGSGLINRTWKVSSGADVFILQKINQQVFKTPEAIADNITRIGCYLQEHHPHYFFPTPLPHKGGNTLLYLEDYGYFRLTPFVQGTHSVDAASNTQQAYEAAMAFGRFTHLLSLFDANQLQLTLPDFHNLSLRYRQFLIAITNGNKVRLSEAEPLVKELQAQQHIVQTYEDICTSDQFRVRVAHHDTKISNVLFNDKDRSICVIDLDTIMPGYFISDVGDMLRTYLSPVSEEESDLSKIKIRTDFFKAIVDGYLHHMHAHLTQKEKEAFLYAGKFMIYMQALRFITDYLNDDVYYGTTYPKQNLVRTQNQATLLQQLNQNEAALQKLVTEALQSFAAPKEV